MLNWLSKVQGTSRRMARRRTITGIAAETPRALSVVTSPRAWRTSTRGNASAHTECLALPCMPSATRTHTTVTSPPTTQEEPVQLQWCFEPYFLQVDSLSYDLPLPLQHVWPALQLSAEAL